MTDKPGLSNLETLRTTSRIWRNYVINYIMAICIGTEEKPIKFTIYCIIFSIKSQLLLKISWKPGAMLTMPMQYYGSDEISIFFIQNKILITHF